MSHPLLRKKQVAGLITAKRKPDGGTEEIGNAPEVQESHPLSSAASDLMAAVEAKDIDGMARALEAAFQICESQPHEEYQESEE